MSRTFLAAFASVAAFTLSAAAEESKPDPRENLKTVVPEAIRLLEAKEHATLIRNFVPPEMLQRLTQGRSLEEVAQEFGDRKADRLLKALKSAKDVTPELSDNGNKATYTLPEEIDGKQTIVFARIGKYWYISN